MTFDAQEKCIVLCGSSIKHGQSFGQNASEELVDLESQIGRAKQQIQPTPPQRKKKIGAMQLPWWKSWILDTNEDILQMAILDCTCVWP